MTQKSKELKAREDLGEKPGSKFYKLEHDEWLKQARELSHSESNVLYYIRTFDPYNKGIKICASAIAIELGVNRSTVSRALKTLDLKGYIDLEILTANVMIKGKGQLQPDNSVAPTQQNEILDVAPTQQALHPRIDQCTHASINAPTQQAMLETQSEQKLEIPKISKINKNNKIRSDKFDFEGNSELDEIQENRKQEIVVEKFEDFIIRTIETERKIKIGNRDAYLSKVLEKDTNVWRSRYTESQKPKHQPKQTVIDPWRIEGGLISAMLMRDYDYVIETLRNLPHIAEEILGRHPDWRQFVCV